MISIRDAVKLMIKNWEKLIIIITFDILFVLLLPNIRFILIYINKWLYNFVYSAGITIQLAVSVLLLLTEILLFIFIYLFFKYFVIHYIQNFFKKTAFKDFALFVKANFIAFLPIAAITGIFVLITSFYFKRAVSLGDPFTLLTTLILNSLSGLIIFIYAYTLLNLFQNMFLKEKNLKKIIKKAFVSSFRFNSYKLYWPNLKILFVFGIFLLIVHIFMKMLVLTTISAYMSYYGYYKLFLISSLILIGYFLLLLNRLNFYLACNKNDKKN